MSQTMLPVPRRVQPALPVWTPPETTAAEQSWSSEQDEQAAALDDVISFRPQAGDTVAWTNHARRLQRIAGALRQQDQLVFTYLGRVAAAVAEYKLYKFLGYTNASDFWRELGWPAATVRTALAFHRKAVPVATQIGVDLSARADELSTLKARELARIADEALEQPAWLETPEGQRAYRERIEQVLSLSDGDLRELQRARAGEPERLPYFVACQLVRPQGSSGPPVIRATYEWTPEQIRAAREQRAYPIFTFQGETLTLPDLEETIAGLTNAQPTRSRFAAPDLHAAPDELL